MQTNRFQPQRGWSLFELVTVMAIMGLLLSVCASWLGGRMGVIATTQRDQTIMALRQQQLVSLSPSFERRVWQWQPDQIADASGVLFSLSDQTQYLLPETLKNQTWYWDGFGRFRGEDDEILCLRGCTVHLLAQQDRASLCVYGEGGIWPSSCDET